MKSTSNMYPSKLISPIKFTSNLLIKFSVRKILTYCPTIKVIYVEIHEIFNWVTIII